MTFDLSPTEDQRQILDAAQAMLDAHYPLSRLRDSAGSDALKPLADFGAFALAMPEQSGGAGFTLVEEALLHVLLGRHLVSVTALTAPIAARIAEESGRSELATGILEGTIIVAASVACSDGLLLLDGENADFAIVRTGGQLRLLDLADLARHPETALGQGRPLHRVALTTHASNTSASEGTANAEQVLISAQLLGIAEGARDLAVGYASTREQFGRPIGSFQAIKHHCANMAIRAEQLSAQLDMAAMAVRGGHEDAGFQVAVLCRIAPGIALENARTCIQIHGGIGFSAEADAHLFLKQAHVLAQLCDPGELLSLKSPMTPTRKES
jgi:alkylation response protein AidB-like acyl-CoA dehydrogenase